MAMDARDDDTDVMHTPLGYEERVLAPELKKAIIDSEGRLHAVVKANFDKLEQHVAAIERSIDTRAMEARVDALESRLRELDELFRRIAGNA